jgi:hypothetical protein
VYSPRSLSPSEETARAEPLDVPRPRPQVLGRGILGAVVHAGHEVDAGHPSDVGGEPGQHHVVVGPHGAVDAAAGSDAVLAEAAPVPAQPLDHGGEHGARLRLLLDLAGVLAPVAAR